MPISIRSRLLALMLAVLLPAVVAAAWVIERTYDAERTALARNLRDTTRALSQVVEGELDRRATIARLLSHSRALAQAPELSAEQLLLFDQQARRSMQGLQGWVELETLDTELLSTRLTPSFKGRRRDDPPGQLADVARAGNLRRDPGSGALFATVVHPVQRDGATVLELGVTMLPAELQGIIDRQELPREWVGTVLDAAGTVVARHPGGQGYTGREATPELRQAMKGRREGGFDSRSLDGHAVSGYFSTSASGWTYITAMPQRSWSAAVSGGLLQLALGASLLLGVAVVGALGVARRIVEPINQLAEAAAHLRAGEPVPRLSTGIDECNRVADALAEAGEASERSRVELQRQVADAVAQTRSAEQRASQSQRVEALGRLTGGVAHDFNNLLGVINNSAHLIQRAETPEAARLPIAAVLRAVEAGSRLTQHLMRFAGRHTARPGRLELGSTLAEMHDLLRMVLGKRVQVDVAVAPGTHHIAADAGELELALINLALNARDALPQGGRVWVDARNAETADRAEFAAALPASKPGDFVLISFNDDGSGIDEAIVGQVFEPFFTTKQIGRGTGLGLSQVHGFCVQAGGAARIASTQGAGTSVFLLLPAARPGDAQAAAPPGAADGLRQRVQGLRVLLVEDNEELASVTAQLLGSFGCIVQAAGSPAQALNAMDGGARFDVVLSDVVMPGELDGVALARQLRQRHPGLPVVLISGYSNALAQIAQSAEFVVLHKPCTPEQLLGALAGAVSPSRGGG